MGKTTFVEKEKDVSSSRTKTLSELEHGTVHEEWKPRKAEWAVMITIAVVSLMVALDATILVPVLPKLAVDLNGSATDAFWAGTSYLLTCAVFQPFIASLSDIFGRREMLLVSILFFASGTALCAPIAKDFTVLFAGRSLQGIGGGGIITMGQVIYADIVPLRQRPKYFSIVLGAWALGSVLGPLAGGLFVEHLDWKWCFYANFPFCLIGFIAVPVFVNLSPPKSSLWSKLKRIDYIGGFLFIGGMTSFLIGLSWAGVQFDWLSVQTIAPMGAGALSVLLAIIWEMYVAREPFLRPSLFYSSSAMAAYACAWCQGFLLFCALYYVPFYFMAIKFTTPTQSGINIFPVTCLLLPGSIIVSFLTSRLGRFRWAVWIGWIITAVGCGLLVLFDQDTSTTLWAVILAIFGVGNGMVLTSVNVAIQAISHVEDAGRAGSMYAFMRTMGMAIGVAVGGTTFQNVMSHKLDDLHLPESIAHNAEGFVDKLVTMKHTDPVRVGALLAYIQGFRGVFWVMTGTACFGFLVSLIIKRHSMDKILESKFVLGGAGATLREKVDAVEARAKRLSKHASQLLVFPSQISLAHMSRYSHMGAGGTFYIEGDGVFAGDQKRKNYHRHNHHQYDENSDMIPLHPTGGNVIMIPIDQAPAVSFYIAKGGRRVPVDISTSARKQSFNIVSRPNIPRATYLCPELSRAPPSMGSVTNSTGIRSMAPSVRSVAPSIRSAAPSTRYAPSTRSSPSTRYAPSMRSLPSTRSAHRIEEILVEDGF